MSQSRILRDTRLHWTRGPWTGVRYRKDAGPDGQGGFEMRCEDCADKGEQCYWPLDLEFWNPNKGMTKCKACWNAYQRASEKRRRAATQKSAAQREYQRQWAARKRQQQREDEGRQRYERRKAA